MAKNFVHDGRRIPCAAPAGGVVSGRVYAIGQIFGVALTTAAAGETFVLAVGGVWRFARATGTANPAGTVMYWDSTNNRVTATATNNLKIGVVEIDAASGDTDMTVRLNTSFG